MILNVTTAKEWGLDPIFWVPVKIPIHEILSAARHGTHAEVYFYKERPIRKVDIIGIVTQVDNASKFVSYTLDDGSGTIPCLEWIQKALINSHCRKVYQLGDILRIVGNIADFNGIRQINAKEIYLLHDSHSECLRWLEMCDIDRTVYSKAPVSFMSQNINSVYISERSGFCSVNISDEILKILKSAGITSFEFSKLPNILCSNGLFDVIPEEKEILNLISKAVHAMVRSGDLFLSNRELDLYDRICPEGDLAEDTFKVIFRSHQDKNDGVNSREALDILREDNRYRFLSIKSVDAAIQHLLESSQVFENQPGRFKPLQI